MSNFLPVVKLEFINDKQVPAVTSQQLAEAFGKQHAHVMRDIRETTAKCSKLFSASNFGLAEYLDEQGKSRPRKPTLPSSTGWKKRFVRLLRSNFSTSPV